ncbi:MAG: alpha amylase C-terminal domain-containing protein [Rhodospirillales bacterium]|nr:alpha amylase C-terminal domain-containing protein [Rhodospirillales bacterium]
MPTIPVNFEYRTGLRSAAFVGARLTGSWNTQGMRSDQWSTVEMQPFTADDGCPAFRATVQLDDSQIGQTFRWGVSVSTQQSPNVWGIPTEVSDASSTDRNRSFTLTGAGQTNRYYLTHCRRLGANKLYSNGGQTPAVRFSVWAPNARAVELVRGDTTGGYIWNDGRGVTATFPMTRGEDGVWSTDPASPGLAEFAGFDHTAYMFRITKDNGTPAYRSDLYSRCQIGTGKVNPEGVPPPGGGPWSGRRQDLDGVKSCSIVVDPERVAALMREVDAQGQPVWPETQWQSDGDFWRDEFDPARPVPARLEDLVIYELHIDGLGLGDQPAGRRGTLDDALNLLDYLVDLGVNAIELMPLAEYEGWSSWGYGTSHYMAIEYAGGGRDQFKHFIKACHQRGIAVLVDVVYNHYTPDGERAEWAYDSDAPETNIYYWYEGRSTDYPNANPPGSGGYIDNMSTGYAPRFWEETVRKMFVSSAAALLTEFHVDGFRVDQTTSIHSYAVLHADGRAADNARSFGGKFLREWCRTLQLLKPNVFLTAEDHSGWSAVTQPTEQGGMGFNAVWYSDYYHHLIGDAQNDSSRARLLKFAGYGDGRTLNMTWFAGALTASASGRVIYHESHDEAGNSYYMENGQEVHSARTISVAVNGAALTGETRRYAEARTRFAAGITLLAPGIPMFFMGEEVGASLPYRYNDFLDNREDFLALRQGAGARLFRFYQDVLRLRRAHPAFRSRNCQIVHVHDANRIIAFHCWTQGEDMLVVGSLNDWAFRAGYRLQDSRIADGQWREILNSDADAYGGTGLLNSNPIASGGGVITVNLPANSVLVLQRQ